MQDDVQGFDPDLADLPKGGWLTRLAGVAEAHGFFKPLGKRHFAAHVSGSDTLIVTFETIQGMRALSDNAEPLGWSMVREHGWSHLCVASDGDTWFRDSHIYGLFDTLIDDGFFDDYEQILFYGAGPCGYAAAAYSVAAPGARVVAIQPQATLDPRVTEWDDR
ncbi:MAG: phosphoadenosine phosphosulfate reductase, partial [Pseudomonadota bacterium]